MSYFDGIQFVTWGDVPESQDLQHNRFFDGYYGLQFTVRGPLEYAVGDETRLATASGPCLLVTGPGMRFHYGTPPGKTRHHRFVCFKGERVKRYRREGLLPEITAGAEARQLRRPEVFAATLLELVTLLETPGGARSARAVWLLEGLLLELNEPLEGIAAVRAELGLGIEALLERIRRNPQRTRDWAAEAAKLHISSPHFRRVFKAISKCAPLQFQLECQLNLGAKLLRETRDPLRQIAPACGFNDEFYFSRLFKKHRGITPRAYRRECAS